MNCPHCQVPLYGLTVCPKCKYNIDTKNGGDLFVAWCIENDEDYLIRYDRDYVIRKEAQERAEKEAREAREAAEKEAREAREIAEREAREAEVKAVLELLLMAEAARRQLYNETALDNGLSGYYEYKIISLYDENGILNPVTLGEQFTLLSAEGWHLVSEKSSDIEDAPDVERLHLSSKLFEDRGMLCFERYISIEK